MLEERTWEEFQENGLLWFVNRIIHLFGWVIVIEYIDGKIHRVYPARTEFRGFHREDEDEGFYNLTSYLSNNVGALLEECILDSEKDPPFIISSDEDG